MWSGIHICGRTRNCYTAGSAKVRFADSLLAEREGALFILAGIRHGLIHLLGSDTHSVDKRPPRLREAMELLQKSKKLPSREELEQLAEDILQGEILEPAPCTPMKKFLGFR